MFCCTRPFLRRRRFRREDCFRPTFLPKNKHDCIRMQTDALPRPRSAALDRGLRRSFARAGADSSRRFTRALRNSRAHPALCSIAHQSINASVSRVFSINKKRTGNSFGPMTCVDTREKVNRRGLPTDQNTAGLGRPVFSDKRWFVELCLCRAAKDGTGD